MERIERVMHERHPSAPQIDIAANNFSEPRKRGLTEPGATIRPAGISPLRVPNRRSFFSAIKTLAVAASMALVTGATTSARADDGKRPLQDYGAPKPKTTVGDVAEWPVRVVLFPLYVVNEYVLRRPIGALVKAAEKGRWIETAQDVLTFGHRGAPLGELALFPSALFDFGLKPSVGFNANWKYVGSDKNSIKAHFGTWGADWIAGKLTDLYALSANEDIFVTGLLMRRLDNPFSGYGPYSRQDDRVRYSSTVSEAALGYESRFWRSSAFRSKFGTRTLSFGEGECCGEPNLRQAIAEGQLAAPPGFDVGYRATFQRAELELDTRRARPAPGGGIRIEAHEETVHTFDGGFEKRRSWVKYGGSIGAAVDLDSLQRVITLAIAAELADPLQGTIPFTDQVVVGGDFLMPGFLRGRLVDRSAVVTTLQYRWPVWVFLDGVAHAAVGNVFGEHFEGFDVKAMRLSTGLGFRSNGERTTGFELLFAVGSEPFNDRFKIDSFRLVLGSHHGF